MKNMVLLIDTNVILDDLLFRFPQYEYSFRVMYSCLKDEIKGYMAFHSLSIIWYTLRKKSVSERRKALLKLTDFIEVVGAPHSEVVNAIKNEQFLDFEDCLQVCIGSQRRLYSDK